MDQIRGRSYEEALMLLEYMPFRACEPVLKTLVSVHNQHLIPDLRNGVHTPQISLSQTLVYTTCGEGQAHPGLDL